MQVSKSLQYAVLVAVAVLLVVEPRMARAVPPAFNPSCPTPIPSAATFNNLVPDVTDVPLPVTVSLQPIQITDIDAKCVVVSGVRLGGCALTHPARCVRCGCLGWRQGTDIRFVGVPVHVMAGQPPRLQRHRLQPRQGPLRADGNAVERGEWHPPSGSVARACACASLCPPDTMRPRPARADLAPAD